MFDKNSEITISVTLSDTLNEFSDNVISYNVWMKLLKHQVLSLKGLGFGMCLVKVLEFQIISLKYYPYSVWNWIVTLSSLMKKLGLLYPHWNYLYFRQSNAWVIYWKYFQISQSRIPLYQCYLGCLLRVLQLRIN